jgi:hypothetical protein
MRLILCERAQQRRTFPTFPNLCEQVEWLNHADPGSNRATFPPFRSKASSCVWRASTSVPLDGRNLKPPFQTFPNLSAQVKRLNQDAHCSKGATFPPFRSRPDLCV